MVAKKSLFLLFLIMIAAGFPTESFSGQNMRERIRNRLLTRLDARTAEKTGDLPVIEIRIRHQDQIRRCLIHLPTGFKPGSKRPLLLAFHGGGGSAEQLLASTGLIELADREGWLLAAPDGTGPAERILHTWNVLFGFGSAMKDKVDDVGFVRELLQELRRRYPVADTRIYATGISNGGILCHFLAADPDIPLAAIAPVVGTVGGRVAGAKTWQFPPNPVHPVPVLLINGLLDDHIPLTGGLQRKSVGAPVEIIPAADTARFWCQANGITGPPVTEYDKSLDTDFHRWSGGQQSSEVILAVIRHQGHAWPGGKPGRRAADKPSTKFDACRVMAEFFKRHRR